MRSSVYGFRRIVDRCNDRRGKTSLHVRSDTIENAAPVSSSIGSVFPSTSISTIIGCNDFSSTGLLFDSMQVKFLGIQLKFLGDAVSTYLIFRASLPAAAGGNTDLISSSDRRVQYAPIFCSYGKSSA